MSEFDPLSNVPEVNFDDFEKLDPLVPNSGQEEAVSSTQDEQVEDLYSTNVQTDHGDSSPASQVLLDFEPSPTSSETVQPAPETLQPSATKSPSESQSDSKYILHDYVMEACLITIFL